MLSLLFCLAFWSSPAVAGSPLPVEAVELQFYSTPLSLPEVPELYREPDLPLSLAGLKEAYTGFEECAYQPLLKVLGDYRRGMNLSDWHFYQIVVDYAERAFPEASRNFQVLFHWFVLRKSGIDARLFFTASDVYLHALCDEIEFGFYTIEYGGHRYVNLTARQYGLDLAGSQAALTDWVPDQAQMAFRMELGHMPRTENPRIIERLLSFTHQGQTHEVRVFMNRDFLTMVDEYPYYSQAHYFHLGMSREAENSLLPQLDSLMAGKSTRQKVAFLLSFTRTAFFYRDDRRRYGKEKPMSPEQTLYHSYSDCEDRSALFFYLVRKLLGIPMIVLDFETHVGVALELEDAAGQTFSYEGKRYVYCEPTGPQDVLKIGEIWEEVRRQPARILTTFQPR